MRRVGFERWHFAALCASAVFDAGFFLFFLFFLNFERWRIPLSKILKMAAKDTSKQILANLIQANETIVAIARSGYSDEELNPYLTQQSLDAQDRIKGLKKKLKDTFSIDYDADSGKSKVIKEGSSVEVLVNHMDGMKGSTAIVKSYSIPAMLSDITMKDGMKMNNHKWLTNDEVKLK